MERIWDHGAPIRDADGTYMLQLLLGATGAMPPVSLDDPVAHTKWMFEHPKRSAMLKVGIAIAHMTGAEIAAAFEAVTGKRARYENVPLHEELYRLPKGKIGANASPGFDDPILSTAAEHFGPWWNIFRDSGVCWQRDYELLDEIIPNRIRSVEEWMRKVHFDGTRKRILRTGLSL
jgi:hypothetical protein